MAATTDSSAINALTYSYTALTTGAQVVGQQTLWTDQRIRSTVNGQYVSGRLKEAERSRLNQPLAFGGNLTDDTYLDFILERARKLYLALCEVGKSDRIFRAIDLAYDDGDLPLSQETVTGLGLAAKEEDKINRRFQIIQHRYLLRELEEGGHVSYWPEETVPVEYVYKVAATHSLQSWIRVRVPAQPGKLMARRRLITSLNEDPDGFPLELFEDLDVATAVEHEHIAPIWGSYTFKGAAYVVTPFVAEYTLKSFLEAKYPPQFGDLSKPDRQRLLLKWMHCLSDALAYLHANGLEHTAIRPSNIVIDGANQIAFSDIGSLHTFQQDKEVDAVESYNYSVPEVHAADRTPYITAPAAPVKTSFGSRLFRRNRSSSTESSDESSTEGSHGEWLRGSTPTNLPKTSISGAYLQDEQRQNVTSAGHFHKGQLYSHDLESTVSPNNYFTATDKADIFSLGCVFVNILSYMHKLRSTDVTKHIRSTRKATRAQKLTGSRFDTSFHANLPRVHSWLKLLEDKAFDNDDACFRAVPHLNQLIRAMLCPDPKIRPTAATIREHIGGILTQYAKIKDEDLHCRHQPDDFFEKHTSYSTDPASASTAPSSVSSPEARSSAYTASSKYGSTRYSGASVPAARARHSVLGDSQVQSMQANFSQQIPWRTFPKTPA